MWSLRDLCDGGGDGVDGRGEEVAVALEGPVQLRGAPAQRRIVERVQRPRVQYLQRPASPPAPSTAISRPSRASGR